ncbi:hypothetical protein QE152_g13828 [Popillia japonica]|uniref:Uncharacterized protein n=1 Tax=Popillia japonica TaxID=7064 RepID=A0AAW1LAS5_POPJA
MKLTVKTDWLNDVNISFRKWLQGYELVYLSKKLCFGNWLNDVNISFRKWLQGYELVYLSKKLCFGICAIKITQTLPNRFVEIRDSVLRTQTQVFPNLEDSRIELFLHPE